MVNSFFAAIALLLFFIEFALSGDSTQRVIVDPDSRIVTLAPAGDKCTKQETGNLRQRIVDNAVIEWAKFGFPVWDISSKNLRLFPSGTYIDVTPLNPRLIGNHSRLIRRKHKEDSAGPIHKMIGGYWAVVPGSATQPWGGIYEQNKMEAASKYNVGWVAPWSAAFISWVMCESGLDASRFVPSASHFVYVDEAIKAAQGSQGDFAFKAIDLDDAGIPRPGDLICADVQAKYLRVADRAKELGEPRSMHCDIVIGARGNRTFQIGGNVVDAVTMTVLRIVEKDNRRMIEQIAKEEYEVKPFMQWFAVLRLQDDGDSASLEEAICRPETVSFMKKRVGRAEYEQAIGGACD